ncbi:zinc finger MYM-type protein 1-like [Solenopsis invicta]|uniref:zinc finger MYM-type protein 1-like n=1 Tax=Solenopsis invicta TaxID=13686 RepID=UPI00193D76D9|nr:zinc finger MYM-type protein 1-like [Solenopsis invicta]
MHFGGGDGHASSSAGDKKSLVWREIDAAFESRILTDAVINADYIEPRHFLEDACDLVIEQVLSNPEIDHTQSLLKNTSPENEPKLSLLLDHSSPDKQEKNIGTLTVLPNPEIYHIQSSLKNTSHDPGNWAAAFTEEIRLFWIKKGPEFFQNKDKDFLETARSYKEANDKVKIRHLNKSVFVRTLQNGEKVNRKWLLHSSLKKSVYCFSYCLFSSSNASFSSSGGCNDWKYIQKFILEHENSLAHRESMMTYIVRSKNVGTVDNDLRSQYNTEMGYWKDVLKKIVGVIKFLASRGFAFRGDNQTIGSQSNGNYLGCLELLSQFDPFLSEHIKKYGNAGKGISSYLSANICNEFINAMGKQVLHKILTELKTAKYYSISVDSTPDYSHIDQMTFIVRYIKDGTPVERFLAFTPIKEHKAEYLSETVQTFLDKYGISLKDCRGQSYDNASTGRTVLRSTSKN